MATGYELEIITIVLLGGVSIFGGAGRMSGVLLAVLIVLNLRNGFGLANVGGNTQIGVIGAILIGSVLAQNVIQRLSGRAAAERPEPAGLHLDPNPECRLMSSPVATPPPARPPHRRNHEAHQVVRRGRRRLRPRHQRVR